MCQFPFLHRQECLNFRQGTKQKRRCCSGLLRGAIFPLELEQNAEKCHFIQQMRKRDNPYDPKKQKVDITLSALRKNAAKINSNELKNILCIYTYIYSCMSQPITDKELWLFATRKKRQKAQKTMF
jgi:hypothetical protein